MSQVESTAVTASDDNSTQGFTSEPGKLDRRAFLRLAGAGFIATSVGSTAVLSKPAAAAVSQYIDFNAHAAGHFSKGRKTGVAVENGSLRLSNPKKRGSRYVGTLISRPVKTDVSYDTLIPAWNARTPGGTKIVLDVRVRYSGSWSNWLSLGPYSATGASKSRSTTHTNWRVDIDTIRSRHGERAVAYQYRLGLISKYKSRSPRVWRVSLVASQVANHGKKINVGNLTRVYGKSLPVPERSQYDFQAGAAWCSPTSLSMVTSYWGNRANKESWKKTVPKTARGVYDAAPKIWGNWPFNTGYSGHLGLKSSVSRFNSLQQVERWIDKGIPVIASVAWDNRYTDRRLDNASIPRAVYGHLLVIVGFTRAGDVVVNDPAASPRSAVRRVYKREQFARAWLNSDRWRGGRSDGVVYLVHPRNHPIPYAYASKGSW
jgi:hypothetical protein